MNHRTLLHHNHMDSATYRQQYRLEWQEWLAKQDFDLFVTLNFNHDTTPAEEPNTIKACNIRIFPYIPPSFPGFPLPEPSSAAFHQLIVYRTHSVMV
jgi:hypothetical protein